MTKENLFENEKRVIVDLDDAEKIKFALEIIEKFGNLEDTENKIWVLDQVLRVLTGCKFIVKLKDNKIQKLFLDNGDVNVVYSRLEPVNDYCEFVESIEKKTGVKWNTGVAPE